MKCHSASLAWTGIGLMLLLVALAGAGCSSKERITLHGSVSYKGQPVQAGIVKFYGPGDHSSMAYIRNGTFRITDIPPGQVQVTVEPESSGGEGNAIPPKYADPKTSGLSFNITSGTRDLPINLD
jgi:hypothetical protein